MKFFTDPTPYTHKGSFYLIPVYLNLDEEDLRVEGTNILFDKLLVLMTYFHNYVVELVAQTFAAILGRPHEAGFPFWIKEEIEKD